MIEINNTFDIISKPTYDFIVKKPSENRYSQFSNHVKFALVADNELAHIPFRCKEWCGWALGDIAFKRNNISKQDIYLDTKIINEKFEDAFQLLMIIDDKQYKKLSIGLKPELCFNGRLNYITVFLNHMKRIYNLKDWSIEEKIVFDKEYNTESKAYLITIDSWFIENVPKYTMLLSFLRMSTTLDYYDIKDYRKFNTYENLNIVYAILNGCDLLNDTYIINNYLNNSGFYSTIYEYDKKLSIVANKFIKENNNQLEQK